MILNNPDWQGAGVSLPANIGYTGGQGSSHFMSNQNVGKPKTTLEIFESLVKKIFAP